MRFVFPRLPARVGPALFSALLLITACTATDGGAGATAGTGDNGDNAGGGTASVENGTVAITANQLEFNVETIEAPAGEEFTVTLTNMEGVPHDFAVFTEQGGEELAQSDVVTGPDQSVEVTVGPLEPGEYYFECTIHPSEMNGTIVVEG